MAGPSALRRRASARRVRFENPGIQIEILTPDFRGKGRMDRALEVLAQNPPDVFNHNIETVPIFTADVRPGADYDSGRWSCCGASRQQHPHGADQVRHHARPGRGPWSRCIERCAICAQHAVDMVTIGQYLQPSPHHHPVVALLDAGRVQGP
jgi:lipoic acid synthetase